MKLKCFCPEMSPGEFESLDLQELDLSGKTFYAVKTPMVSHFPINPEVKIAKTLREIEDKGCRTEAPLFVLFEDGLLMGRIMVAVVSTTVRDQNIQTPGSFKLIGRVFAGPRFLVPKALKEFDRHLMSRDILTKEFYFWYHSCKICEKERGSRTVIFARIN